jgi:hypothetical protein
LGIHADLGLSGLTGLLENQPWNIYDV